MNKSVLIITYDMIPYCATWGGCQRMYYLGEFLVSKGYQVTVFSVKKGSYDFFGNEISFVNKPIRAKNIFVNAVLMSKGKTQAERNAYNNESNLQKMFFHMRKIVKNNQTLFRIVNFLDKALYNEPGSLTGILSRSWIRSTKREIGKHLSENRVKNVIVSAPPFGMFSIAEHLKKHNANINLILDYRDPWNLWKDNNILSKRLEKRYLNYADRIVCTNEDLALAMSAKFGVSQSKFAVIQNGYSEKGWSGISFTPSTTNKASMIVTYVGVIDLFYSSKVGYRDFSVFLEALETCLLENKKIKFRLVGVVSKETEYARYLKSKYGDNVEFIGVLDNRDSNIEMVQSDVLLLVHTTGDDSSKYLVSGKMYDYIRAGKPILSIGAVGGLHDNLVKRENLGVSCSNDHEEIYRSLCHLYSLWEKNALSVDMGDITKYSREFQYRKYINLLDRH